MFSSSFKKLMPGSNRANADLLIKLLWVSALLATILCCSLLYLVPPHQPAPALNTHQHTFTKHSATASATLALASHERLEGAAELNEELPPAANNTESEIPAIPHNDNATKVPEPVEAQVLAQAAGENYSDATATSSSPETQLELPSDTSISAETPPDLRPRLPAREELSTLLSTIESRQANPRGGYQRAPRSTNKLPRSEQVAARSNYADTNFQALCADCHLLDNNTEWQADIGPGRCENIDCTDIQKLTTYIQRYMPPGNSGSCVDNCAAEMALLVLYQGNTTLAAVHQLAPSLLTGAGIEIRDSETGQVLYSQPSSNR
jgi:hypothetical protein